MDYQTISAQEMSDQIDNMVLRWTPEQREKAYGIVNDIAEDIDNHESRTELRQALAIYADLLWDARQFHINRESQRIIASLEKFSTLLRKEKP